MDMNKANFSEERPAPTLCQQAINMIAGDLLGITFPPRERVPNLDYPHIEPVCKVDDRMDCTVDYDISEFKDVKYLIHMRMETIPLPGINLELLEPMQNGYLPPHKLVTAYVEIDLYLGVGEKLAVHTLQKMKGMIDDIFQVDPEDATYDISVDNDDYYYADDDDDEDDDDDDDDDDDVDETEVKDEL